MKSIKLKNSREKSLLRRHPWIFSGAVAKVEGNPQPGETIEVYSANGDWLARGAFSPHSQILVRVWTFDPDEKVDPEFFNRRLSQAISLRQSLLTENSRPAVRLVNAESDGLPGLVVDRYADFLVCQFLSTGTEVWKATLVSELRKILTPIGIYERSDVEVRRKEGLAPVAGSLAGENPPPLIEIQEDGLDYFINVSGGHKTGFYLDQRENRRQLREFSPGADVLNCFAYSGGFSLNALRGHALHVTNVDTSADVLDLARKNHALNQFSADQADFIVADVFKLLRQYRDTQREFDLVVLDPPKFAESTRQLEQASRGYKDINLLAFKLLKPGGILFTFSCSGLMVPDLFQKIVADAALDAGREAQIIRHLFQAADHPTGLNFPEGSYLKGLVCRAC